MKLSIVIVNYNVRYFLEQCLQSVQRALHGIESEVFVVDNDSQDGSVAMLAERFPWVKVIANSDNPGFAKANNQALRQAHGQYCLLLNPDTVVEENTFRASLDFMDAHPQAGGLGIKMMDGKGQYLPESKRGLPSPAVAFYKLFGLSALFPRSERFARYYLGHLSEAENQEVEVLAGAYMLMRRSVLAEVGLLDEDFFMYGEDIDLSYRILKAGYRNYYLADSSIIHYKGESTKKGSLNYVFVFYQAMIIFAQKHFNSGYARFYALFIYLAIYLRAGLSLFSRLFRRLALPATDAALLWGGLLYIKDYWEHNHRFVSGGEYAPELVQVAFPLYLLAWLAGLFFNGVYDAPPRSGPILRGVAVGTLAILVVYSLLPEDWRFSRAIIILGAFWAALILPLWRYLWHRLSGAATWAKAARARRILLVGEGEELQRIESLVKDHSEAPGFLAYVSSSTAAEAVSTPFIGRVADLPDLCQLFEIDEVIFSGADLSAQAIFSSMSALSPLAVEIKIAPSASQFVIGSNSIHSRGSWYALPFNAISTPANRRAKRLLDLSGALLLLAFAPLLLWFQSQPMRYLRNVFQVLLGFKTWVSYHPGGMEEALPKLKPGVLYPGPLALGAKWDSAALAQLNRLYAKDYCPQSDLRIMISQWRSLG